MKTKALTQRLLHAATLMQRAKIAPPILVRSGRLVLTLFVMLLTATTAWADGSWTSGGCDVTLVGGTLTVSKSASGNGVMEDYYSNKPWKGSLGFITSIIINEGVTHIGNSAFSSCDNESMTSVTIPASVTSIGDYAFLSCLSLATVTFADGSQLETIGDYAFKGTALTSITIPVKVTTIGNCAFNECEKLTSVTIPNGVTSIGDNAFEESGLTSVTIPASMTSIGDYAFLSCLSLATVNVYAPSCSLGADAFNDCPNLQGIYVFDKTSYKSATNWSAYSGKIDNLYSGHCGAGSHYSDVKYVLTGTSPNYTLNIMKTGETSAMADYSESQLWTLWNGASENITSVIIGNGVTHIGNYAFSGCSNLTTVTFEVGSQLESIGANAFRGCTNLTSITIAGNPAIGTEAFPSGAAVTMNLTANSAEGAKWTTFYNNGSNFQADANTTVYKGTVSSGSLVLTEVEDRIVNSSTAVILKSSGNPVMTLTTAESSDTHGNDLQGVMTETTTPANCYTLANGSAGVGFYHYTGAKLGVGKAYLIYTGGGASNFLGFEDEETTSVELKNSKIEELKSFYDLSGRKVENPTKGIYIHNGRKEVVR